jgi:DNA-binding NarL/FixJ family response regulator
MNNLIRVVIVDDHFVTRQGIISLLAKNEKIQVVGEGGTGEDILILLAQHQPDVLIVDLQMPAYKDQPNGPLFEPTKTLKQVLTEYDSTAIVVLSQEHEAQTIQSLAEIGVQGYLLKADSSARLLDRVVEIIHTGDHYFSPEVQKIIYAASPIENNRMLTERQLDILRAIARSPEIDRDDLAKNMNIATSTLQKHITAIFAAMETTNMVATILKAMRMGLISLDTQPYGR